MEGLHFEAKPRRPKDLWPGDSEKPHPPGLTLNQQSCPFFSTSLTPQQQRTGFWVEMMQDDDEMQVQYRLTLVGCLPVHHLTTMAMLPWVVAEISRSHEELNKEVQTRELEGGQQDSSVHNNKTVYLSVSASRVRCVYVWGVTWDPLSHTVLFECRPHHVTKLIHNSQDPSSFGCLVRRTSNCGCYVFRCQDRTKVSEIISTMRQAGKSSARSHDITAVTTKASTGSGGSDSSETCLNGSFLPSTTASAAPNSAVSLTDFAKKFEVLFCGRVSVAHRKAPPALIDECIERFGQSHGSWTHDKEKNGGGLVGRRKRALAFQSNGVGSGTFANGAAGSPTMGKHPFRFRQNSSCPSFEALDENGLSPEMSHTNTAEPPASSNGVQPTNLRENRTMLFMVGVSQIFLVSPDTKKVAMEKNFREISFCSQGIHHVDHFGFICRETVEGGNSHFVCYVFQCTDESLVDEIMLTLKQAFSVAALQQSAKTHAQQCDSCPMQEFHRLCERIEGLQPYKTKLELQRHLASLDNHKQAAVFENTKRAHPNSEQDENELVMACLRTLYEEKQRLHQHTQPAYSKQVSKEPVPGPAETQQQSSSRQRLEEFKTRAKRSLTESFEGIWKGSSKIRAQQDQTGGSEGNVSVFTTKSSKEQPTAECRLSTSSQKQPVNQLRCHNSTGDLKHHNSTGDLKHHNSTGDLKHLDKSLLSSSSQSSLSGGDQPNGSRRRANTFSHFCTPPSSESSPVQSSPSTPQDLAPVTRTKLIRYYSVSTDSPHQSNDIEFLSTTSPASAVGGSPWYSRRHSWRQKIFLRVATPQKNIESNEHGDSSLDGSQVGSLVGRDSDLSIRALPEEKTTRSKEELRELWRKAILQQILLQRMERENQKLQASESNLQNKRLKLDYEEITPCLKEVTLVWEKMLGTAGRASIKCAVETIHAAVAHGVPRQLRGEIWKFLSEQYLLRQTVPSRPPATDTPYKELLKQLTSQQHAILIDLGRTFPNHPYFQVQLGAGQLSLYNLLKAYSLLDPEVGYCQGLSFIAGVLLLHMDEEEAFNMLKFLMFDVGLRKQYRPDMIVLQIQMYELSRLLHDYHRDLYSHLEQHEIGPSLYATPWFLTAFASHFPLGFVARVFDMLFLQGSEVIFKVALSLLGSHKPLILQHESLESIVDFIKTTLPNLGLVQMEKTINQVSAMDVSKQLQAYEVEYHVLQDELLDTSPTLNQHQRAAQLERSNQSLRQQNLDLLEELQVSQARVCSLERRVEVLVQSESHLKEQVSVLEEEKSQLLSTVTHLHSLLSSHGIHTSPDGHLLTHTSPPEKPPGEGRRGASQSHPLALPQGL
ncbi:TBC1 domain family member 1 isoform X2 [Thalassophryne amazonica]|uniref:TBC1 domain family member 1 isoform X2 n=1 Tax=Thalassophryne amazonica TaxID=390379 RepID=UPI0014713F90|nr:TBC1 domain family member 1 isoform X2 [Thalassophryne amazonica]